MTTKDIINKSGLDILDLRDQGLSLQAIADLVQDETNLAVSAASVRSFIISLSEQKDENTQADEDLKEIASKDLFLEICRTVLERAYKASKSDTLESFVLPAGEFNFLKIAQGIYASSFESFMRSIDKQAF